ncbi:hypothetical protein DY000_02036906 [Brassica cretica]|uniref:Wall-associated receptor kinase galacturonan-binding domain-containing protein n=1 Tax=Brassica cretica TaxID=69181 RepID=A0ABQ7BGD0_BRACR|nr:hypothetical protein DY000_02036906 [Brassica cretica]
MSYENTKYSIFLSLFLKLLFLLILYSEDVAASSSCQSQCGGVKIPYPFGIGKGCYMEKSYEIKCLNTTTSGNLAPFLSINDKEVVSISLPVEDARYTPGSPDIYSISFGSVRIKILITSSGCGGKEPPESIMNFKEVGCELTCNTSKELPSNSIPFLDTTGCSANRLQYNYADCRVHNEVRECDGNECCKVGLSEPRQAIGFTIESNNRNSTTTREENCIVAFMTDEVYTSSNATKPRELFDKGYTTLTLSWVIHTKNHSFLSSFSCDTDYKIDYANTTNLVGPEMKCLCDKSTIAEITYAHCVCKRGYTGNAYDPHDGCEDVNECITQHNSCGGMNTCVNTQGGHHCVGDKKKAILIGCGSGFGALALLSE